MSVHICRGPRVEEIHRSSLGVRWCFACRDRREFFYIVKAPVEPGYYDPSPLVRCGNCNQIDGDLGFGRSREWG